MQRIRLRYTRRSRLRFTSHRDLARVLERAIRRAGVPIAFSAGFSPHPKISYVGACPTGVASEAEYLEIGVTEVCDVERVRVALDAALPDGIDLVEAVAAEPGEPSLPDRIDASRWHIRLPGVPVAELTSALAAFLAAEEVTVTRRTKDGTRDLDARGPVVAASVLPGSDEDDCATLELVVRHATPAVRPDDVLSGLRSVAGPAFAAPADPPAATRLAQGRLTRDGGLLDPFAPHSGLHRDEESRSASVA